MSQNDKLFIHNTYRFFFLLCNTHIYICSTFHDQLRAALTIKLCTTRQIGQKNLNIPLSQ